MNHSNEQIRKPGRKRKFLLITAVLFAAWLVAPEWPRLPVVGAETKDWHPDSFWYEPWGASGVHKGIDIFAERGTPVIAPTYGLVLFAGKLERGGNALVLLGPKWRLHYFAHMDSLDAFPLQPMRTGSRIGTVGNTGNAKGKQPHLHYSVVTMVPYPWRIDDSTQGWRKMFFLDPEKVLDIER